MKYSKADEKKIRDRAYYLWLEDGANDTHDPNYYWLKAEREMTQAEVEIEEVLEIGMG